MTQSANPLQQFFRRPAIYMRLPSDGKFWPADALDMPHNHELPVYPMTAIDEITYRTPDALFNGQAVVDVVQSCMPNVKDAWQIPHIDMNAILVAIRIASYGTNMEVISVCPNCTHEGEFDMDLNNVLGQMSMPDYDKTVRHGDLEVSFHPISYRIQNQSSATQFEQQRTAQMITQSDLSDEEKILQIANVMRKITDLTVTALAQNIAAIRTPSAFVTEFEHILEFLKNCDRKTFTQIRDHAIALKQDSDLKPVKIRCRECDHEYEQGLVLDQSSFFGPAS